VKKIPSRSESFKARERTRDERRWRKIPKTTLGYWALIAEIAGAIAIVVSVIYLGVQIRANTKVLRSRAHYNALSLAQRSFEMASIPGNICIIKTSTALFQATLGRR